MVQEESAARRGCETPCFERELVDRLTFEARCSIRDLDIEVRGDVVILHGRAPSYYVKQLAQEAVKRIPDRFQVVNRITVVSTGTALDRHQSAKIPRK